MGGQALTDGGVDPHAMRSRVSAWAVAGALCAALLASAAPASAQSRAELAVGACQPGEPMLSRASLDLAIIDVSVVDALRLVSEQSGLSIVIDDALTGQISGLVLKGSVVDGLDRIAAEADGIWWWTGRSAKMIGVGAYTEELLDFPDFTLLRSGIEALCIPTEPLAFSRAAGTGLIKVAGPPELVREVAELAETMEERYGRVRFVRGAVMSEESIR